MMQSERILPSWETFDIPCSNLDQSRLHDPQMDFLMWDNLDFSSSFTSPEESSVISSNSNVPTMFSDELFDLPNLSDGIFIPSPMEGLETISSGEFVDILINSDDECSSPCWDIEETKQLLQDHARELGLNLQIDQKSVSDLASEITRAKKRGQSREWLVFNCMFRLPHMARRRQRSHATMFLQVAKEILANHGAPAGMVTLGYGETEFCSRASSGFSSFLDKLVKHYQALFESLEQSFPVHLADARTAVESLFLAPYMSSLHWFLDSEKLMEISDLQSQTGLEGQKLSKESIIEAKQIVNEIENEYKVKIEGHREHEMVLEWKGTPLVRVSTWM